MFKLVDNILNFTGNFSSIYCLITIEFKITVKMLRDCKCIFINWDGIIVRFSISMGSKLSISRFDFRNKAFPFPNILIFAELTKNIF